jgi:putative transposase
LTRSNRERHRPEEVVAELRQADEALAKGTPIAEVARSLGVSEVTLHRWRAEYGAVERDAVRRMKELDIQILKEVAKGEF